jgi:23S rRNA (cytosine1962-C5)-methyltransferase
LISITLKPHREKSLLNHHPWIFSGAVASIQGDAASGDTIIIRSSAGEFLAHAAYSPKSQIIARVWSWDESEKIDQGFFAKRLAKSIAARSSLSVITNAVRWVNAESDGIPGLVVDRYAQFAVCQFLTAGAEKWKKEIADVLMAQDGIIGVYERSDVDVREKEGLGQVVGLLSGLDVPDLVEVVETLHATSPHATSLRILVDVKRGHKTGFYLDQRENRDAVRQHAKDRDVLNAFCYTGAFSVAAWQGGAKSVVSLDSSAPALSLAKKNLELNALPVDGITEGDVFTTLRAYRDSRQSFDLIILDPPKLAHTQAQVDKATRAYKDMNLLALKLLRPGGILITFSCSGSISEDLFQKIIFGASLDAKRDVQIIKRLTQASDHLVRVTFPEGTYLKGLVCRIE